MHSSVLLKKRSLAASSLGYPREARPDEVLAATLREIRRDLERQHPQADRERIAELAEGVRPRLFVNDAGKANARTALDHLHPGDPVELLVRELSHRLDSDSALIVQKSDAEIRLRTTRWLA
jgi:hypothetical protein